MAVDAVLAWACARALARHPRLNGTFAEERLRLQPQVHVGIGVAVGEELHVPVIRQAQAKDIAAIDRELAALVGKSQGGRLAAADIAGGTFTLTNLGMYPVEEFAAVLNAPQVAIAAAGRMAGRSRWPRTGASAPARRSSSRGASTTGRSTGRRGRPSWPKSGEFWKRSYEQDKARRRRTRRAPRRRSAQEMLRELGPERAAGMYRTMLVIRQFEERVKFLFLEGMMPGTIHQYQGQEACAVGVCAALRAATTSSPPRTARTGTPSPRACRWTP